MKLLKASAVALIILMSGGGLVSAPLTLAAELTNEETAMLEKNPALADLAANAPDLLPQAFEIIARAAAGQSGGGQRGVEGLDAADAQLLSENPTLLQVWRSSPEASADLLALIKSAAGGGKPTK